MCFSPEASFSSSVVLAGLGVMTVRRAWYHDRSMLVLACFPVIWAAHQFIEGMVWLTLSAPQEGMIFRYLYMIVACLVWPIMMPLGVIVSETSKRIRLVATGFIICGTCLTVMIAIILYQARGIDVVVLGHSLCYRTNLPRPSIFFDYAYVVIILTPLLFSSRKFIKLFGALVAIAWGLSFYFLQDVYFSVWCMAAALLSVFIFFAIKRAPQTASVGPIL
jgi:hypothetical protein